MSKTYKNYYAKNEDTLGKALRENLLKRKQQKKSQKEELTKTKEEKS